MTPIETVDGADGSRSILPWIQQKRVRPLLGTFVDIDLRARALKPEMDRWIAAGFAAVADIDQAMSRHRPDSDISHLNNAPPQGWVDIQPLTKTVLLAANDLFRSSRGAFDIRCGSSLRKHRGDSLKKEPVEIRGLRARKSDSRLLDLGGIAKGFAVDHAVRRIRSAADTSVSGVVNAGGDLRVFGPASQTIVLRIPRQSSTVLVPMSVRSVAMATSSSRDLPSLQSLTEASTIQMPEGQQSSNQVTVTVFAKTGLIADALTKVVMTRSSTVAKKILSGYGARALVFGSDGELADVLQGLAA